MEKQLLEAFKKLLININNKNEALQRSQIGQNYSSFMNGRINDIETGYANYIHGALSLVNSIIDKPMGNPELLLSIKEFLTTTVHPNLQYKLLSDNKITTLMKKFNILPEDIK